MDFATKIITNMPLDVLCSENGDVDAERTAYIYQKEISELFRNGPVRIAIANIGDKLLWIRSEDIYKIYKEEIKDHLIPDKDKIYLSRLKDEYGYLASLWKIKNANNSPGEISLSC